MTSKLDAYKIAMPVNYDDCLRCLHLPFLYIPCDILSVLVYAFYVLIYVMESQPTDPSCSESAQFPDRIPKYATFSELPQILQTKHFQAAIWKTTPE